MQKNWENQNQTKTVWRSFFLNSHKKQNEQKEIKGIQVSHCFSKASEEATEEKEKKKRTHNQLCITRNKDTSAL